jgi:hypothetical protein
LASDQGQLTVNSVHGLPVAPGHWQAFCLCLAYLV